MSVAAQLAGFRITRTSTAAQVAQALTAAILHGELVPGMRVRESSLATTMGVSRSSVREALRLMEQRGLIRHESHRGAVVSTLTLAEVTDLYRVREVLELDGVDAVRARTDLGSVAAAVAGLDAALRADPIDVHEVVARDLAVHAAFVDLLGSASLSRFFADVCEKLRFYLAALSIEDRETDRPAELVAQHAAILRALERRDRPRARRLVREHVIANRDAAVAVMRGRGAQPG